MTKKKPALNKLKKIFLKALVVSLCISAIIAITVFLAGEFDDTAGKLLLMTLTFGLFSLTALCAATLYDRGRWQLFAMIGMIISVLGFVHALTTIWGSILADGKPLVIIGILTIAVAHVSLLLLIQSKNSLVNLSLLATILCVGIVAGMLIYLTISLGDGGVDDMFFRWLGVFAVLDVLGTITTPILKKTNG